MKRKSIFEKLNNKDGAALVTVLVIFLTLVIIVTSATYAALGNFERSKKTTDNASTYYIAEAGLNEAYEHLKLFFETRNENTKFDDDYAEEFMEDYALLEGKSLVDDKVVTSYGLIMNQEAFSNIDLKYDGPVDGIDMFTLKSIGLVGTNTRVVQTTFSITTESIGEGYNPNSIVAIDLSEFPDPIKFSSGSKSFKGPIITNKPIETEHIPVSGPIVTNNKVTFISNGINWQSAILISSNTVNVKLSSTDVNVQAIMLKKGGSINFTGPELGSQGLVDWQLKAVLNNFKLPYLYLPTDENFYITYNGTKNDALTQVIMNNAQYRKIYYQPLNYNPYEDKSVDLNIRNVLFGEEPSEDNDVQYNFKDYFEEEFVLDNLHKDGASDQYLPSVVMPKIPNLSSLYPNGVTTVPPLSFEGVTVIDEKNNFDYGHNNYQWANKTFDLTSIQGSTGKGRFFKSIKLGGTTPLIVDVKDKNIVLVTEKLELNEQLIVKGNGTLKIYVIGELNPQTDNRFITENHLKVNGYRLEQEYIKDGKLTTVAQAERVQIIVYETTPKITFKVANKGNGYFGATIFSDNLNLNATGKFHGNFVSAYGDLVQISGGGSASSQLIYAPQASLKLSGGGVFKGVITAKNYEYGGGVDFIFDSSFDKSFVDDILSDVIVPGGEGSSGTKGTYEEGAIIEVNE